MHDASLSLLCISNLRDPLSLLEMISHWLRFKGNDTFIIGSEREVLIFPCTDETEKLSQPFHHDRRLSGEAHG